MSDDYTPSTDDVRSIWLDNVDSPARFATAEFDRWLESVRAEERERIARNIEALPDVAIPGYFATRPGGYVTRTLAATIVREGA